MKARTENMKKMLAEAREKAWAEMKNKKDIGPLAGELVTQTSKNHVKAATPIYAVAKAFVDIIEVKYENTVYNVIKGHYSTSMKIQKDLIEARKGVDYAYILARRLQILAWGELRKA